jgi:hypothetical protein
VQVVGELVSLRAQGVGDVPLAVERSERVEELGPVAQGHHAPHLAITNPHGAAVDDEEPLAREHQLVGEVFRAHRQRQQVVCSEDLGRRTSARGRREVQQPQRLVVDQGQPTARVQCHDAFPHAVQHGVPGPEQLGDLLGLQTEDAPADQPRDDQGPQDSDGGGARQPGHQSRDDDRLVGGEPALEHPDGHDSDYLSGRVADWDLGPQ